MRLRGHPPQDPNAPRRHSIAGEDGFAMASVMFLGAVLILLTAIIAARGFSQSEIEVSDINWEQALHVAEEGIDEFIVELQAVPEGSRDGVTTGHAAADLADKDGAVVAAKKYIEDNPGELRETPEGDVVILRPYDDRRMYAVSFVPSYEFSRHMTRVAVVDYDFAPRLIPGWSASHAFLTGGDAALSSGSSGVFDSTGASNAQVIANGELSVHRNFKLQGCAASAEDDTSTGINCPPPGDVEPASVPLVNPRDVHVLAHFDLCPDGSVRAGPAHVMGSAGAAPCTGQIVSLAGWSSREQHGVRTWEPTTPTPQSAVYYIAGGDFDGKLGGAAGKQFMTVVVASLDDDQSCSGVRSSGNIKLSAGSWIAPHPDGSNLALVAGGDIEFRGSAEVEKLVMAHEQIDFRGGTGSGGAVLAQSACDHPQSPVRHLSEISGGTGITWNGPITTPFSAWSTELYLTVVQRNEL